MVRYCVLTNFVSVIFNSLSMSGQLSEADKLQCLPLFFIFNKVRVEQCDVIYCYLNFTQH